MTMTSLSATCIKLVRPTDNSLLLCTVYAYFYLSIYNRIHILVIELRMTTFLIKKFDDDDDDDDVQLLQYACHSICSL